MHKSAPYCRIISGEMSHCQRGSKQECFERRHFFCQRRRLVSAEDPRVHSRITRHVGAARPQRRIDVDFVIAAASIRMLGGARSSRNDDSGAPAAPRTRFEIGAEHAAEHDSRGCRMGTRRFDLQSIRKKCEPILDEAAFRPSSIVKKSEPILNRRILASRARRAPMPAARAARRAPGWGAPCSRRA